MNLQTEALAKQAAEYAIEFATQDQALYIPKLMEKFAELIVQECVGVCLDRHHTWKWDNELDSDSGPRDCARSIQEHFGVEK